MVHIDRNGPQEDKQETGWTIPSWVVLGCLPFPYLVLVCLAGLFCLSIFQTISRPRQLIRLLNRQGFLATGVLLLISAQLAHNPNEAYLQTAHFLPFFWVWGALVLYLSRAANPWGRMGQWSVILVVATVPLNLVGMLEYALKHQFIGNSLTAFPGLPWLYIGDFSHPRAFSLFDYPNTLANFLVMILGLNIGLLFVRPQVTFLQGFPSWLKGICAANVLLTLLCLYCSGSRNGYLVAALLLIICLLALRSRPWIKFLGLAGLGIIGLTTARFGIAGRHLSWSWVTDDPRVQVWGLAVQLTQQRPFFGHGLGNYKLLYDGEAPGYDFIAHAHNLWLMLSSETGIPIAIALTIAIGLICYRGIKTLLALQEHPDHYAILLSYCLCFLSSVLFSLLDVTLFEVRVNLLAWLSLVVLQCSADLSPIPDDSPVLETVAGRR